MQKTTLMMTLSVLALAACSPQAPEPAASAPAAATPAAPAMADMPMTSWNYKSDASDRRYVGPIAQDFHAAFGLGEDKMINTFDLDGVALAAIQGLNSKVQDLEAENAELKARLERLEAMIGAR